MKKLCTTLMALFLLIGFQGFALAAPDAYIGDAAIYSALDTGSTRPKPHVLLLIDNSQATLNIAAGMEYVPATAYTGTYNRWTVYAADNQGNFSRAEINGLDSSLSGITCNTAGGINLKNTLLGSGTYAGSGTTIHPNLRGAACDTGPTGATYALGNYLNYLGATVVADATSVVKRTYGCTVNNGKSGGAFRSSLVANGCVDIYQRIGDVAAPNLQPGVEAGWQSVWSVTNSGCILGKAGSYCASPPNSSSPAPINVNVTTFSEWSSTGNYIPSGSFVGGSQRKIIYDALAQVVDGARGAVNFAAMTYNPTIQGGLVIHDLADLSTNTAFANFKAALPRYAADGTTLAGAAIITAGPQRPQAEALYDAGHFYKAKYPSSGTIPSDAVFPLDSTAFSEGKISAAMAATYPASNRNECGYNHIILITNGLSRADSNPSLAYIADADGDGRPNEGIYGDGGSHYLDDVAAYLKKQEGIITHTVLAFQTNDPLVEAAAHNGGGKFYNVYDANGLAEALTKLLATIVLETDTSFVAPVVPASSTNRTISSNRVYLGLFKPQNNRPWLGNLKKYGVSSDLTLLGRSGNPATDASGDFIPNSKSFWGDDGSAEKRIMSIDGLLPLAAGSTIGDGGNVAAGGTGGTLILDLRAGLLASPKKLAQETRKIYTVPSGSASTTLTHADNRFATTNAKITAAALGVSALERDKLIGFVAGADGYDLDNNGNTEEIRDWVLGDILHSKPLIFSYGSYTEAEETDCTKNKSMIFVGSNDGMFHAFYDCNGKEAWAFIPDNLLPNLKYLLEAEHYYFSDSPPTAYLHDVDKDNVIEPAAGDKVVLIFGQGRGGGRSTLDASGPRGAYYALDVSNPVEPKVLWKVDSDTTGFAELGETWSPPRLAKVKVGTATKVVAVVGGGYDNNEDLRFGDTNLFPTVAADFNTTTVVTNSGNVSSAGSDQNGTNPRGRGVFAIEVATLTAGVNGCSGLEYCPSFTTSGSNVWSYVYANDTNMKYSFPSDLTVLDMDGNNLQDRIYVGDTGGRIWRFDLSSTDVANWTASGRIIFNSNKVGGETNEGRKIFYRPTVALLGGVPTLYFGTGDRNHPLNTAVADRMFAVKDREQLTANYIDVDNLVNLTDNKLQNSSNSTEIQGVLDSLSTTDPSVPGYYGWYVDLDVNVGEKVLASALVFNKQAFYTTYQSSPLESLNTCQVGNLGVSRLYQLNYATAEATTNYNTYNDNINTSANIRASGGDGIVLQRSDRVKNIGVGIPSGIVTLIDASGKVSLMISSSNRVGTYQAPDAKMISPLYWIKY